MILMVKTHGFPVDFPEVAEAEPLDVLSTLLLLLGSRPNLGMYVFFRRNWYASITYELTFEDAKESYIYNI